MWWNLKCAANDQRSWISAALDLSCDEMSKYAMGRWGDVLVGAALGNMQSPHKPSEGVLAVTQYTEVQWEVQDEELHYRCKDTE
eukprot:scaffold293690_cov23-Tisochrysis_lutea.AAC.1